MLQNDDVVSASIMAQLHCLAFCMFFPQLIVKFFFFSVKIKSI